MPELLPYNREAAVAYAHTWAYRRNPAYFDFSGIGGDLQDITFVESIERRYRIRGNAGVIFREVIGSHGL